MKYGCRAHDYGCFTAQELARTLADQGYNAAQLAMPKAIRGDCGYERYLPGTVGRNSHRVC